MIDRKRFDNLSVQALKAVAECSDAIDCSGTQCNVCPFQLEPEYPTICALAYGKALYKRCTK